MSEDMGNNEVINVGIGFATGRKNFKNVFILLIIDDYIMIVNEYFVIIFLKKNNRTRQICKNICTFSDENAKI